MVKKLIFFMIVWLVWESVSASEDKFSALRINITKGDLSKTRCNIVCLNGFKIFNKDEEIEIKNTNAKITESEHWMNNPKFFHGENILETDSQAYCTNEKSKKNATVTINFETPIIFETFELKWPKDSWEFFSCEPESWILEGNLQKPGEPWKTLYKNSSKVKVPEGRFSVFGCQVGKIENKNDHWSGDCGLMKNGETCKIQCSNEGYTGDIVSAKCEYTDFEKTRPICTKDPPVKCTVGKNGKECENGGQPMGYEQPWETDEDTRLKNCGCNCNGTIFTGNNCEKKNTSSQNSGISGLHISLIAVGSLLSLVLIVTSIEISWYLCCKPKN